MKRIILASSLLLATMIAACNDDSGGPPPAPNQSLSLNPMLWVIGPVGPDGTNASVGMSLHPSSESGWSFNFPQAPGHVNYVDTQASIAGKTRVTMVFEIVADPAVKYVATKGDTVPGKVRLYFQKANDNWAQIEGRWWSAPLDLSPGEHTISADLTPDKWININGQNDATIFPGALAASARVGFTFGGMFAGHGLSSDGPAKFILKSYKAE